MVEAVVTAEDARFWVHSGIDWYEVRHALGYRRGGSTGARPAIGRQLWYALGSVPQTGRKRSRRQHHHPAARQEPLSLALAQPAPEAEGGGHRLPPGAALPQGRILELYLNVAELGPEVWGVEAASRRYFRKSARRLTESQAAALAATLPFPLTSNPAFRPGAHAAAAGADSAADAWGADRGAAGGTRSRFHSRATASCGRRGWIRCWTRCGRRWRRCQPMRQSTSRSGITRVR